MRRVLLVIAVVLIGVGIYLTHVYRCRTIVGRSDVILRGRMMELSGDRKHVVIQPMEVFKGKVRAGERQQLLVDIVPRWGAFDIMPPWPVFQTNKIAVFYLRKPFWSSSYERISINDHPRPLLYDVR